MIMNILKTNIDEIVRGYVVTNGTQKNVWDFWAEVK